MLKSLLIKNFILIDEALLNFQKGFNVLCGETGAGKSIIIKALDCALGAKVSKEMILDNSKPAYIEAVFEVDNDELTLSREITSTSKFRINGMLSNLDEIKEKREFLAEYKYRFDVGSGYQLGFLFFLLFHQGLITSR